MVTDNNKTVVSRRHMETRLKSKKVKTKEATNKQPDFVFEVPQDHVFFVFTLACAVRHRGEAGA